MSLRLTHLRLRRRSVQIPPPSLRGQLTASSRKVERSVELFTLGKTSRAGAALQGSRLGRSDRHVGARAWRRQTTA